MNKNFGETGKLHKDSLNLKLFRVLDFVKKHRRSGIVVHCLWGKNRSAALCTAILMLHGGLPWDSAVTLFAFAVTGVCLDNHCPDSFLASPNTLGVVFWGLNTFSAGIWNTRDIKKSMNG